MLAASKQPSASLLDEILVVLQPFVPLREFSSASPQAEPIRDECGFTDGSVKEGYPPPPMATIAGERAFLVTPPAIVSASQTIWATENLAPLV